jgi:hypothetical protein
MHNSAAIPSAKIRPLLFPDISLVLRFVIMKKLELADKWVLVPARHRVWGRKWPRQLAIKHRANLIIAPPERQA